MSRNARRTGSLFSSLNPFLRRVDRALDWKRSRRLRVEVLEDRWLLAGNKIALVVAGLGGSVFPNRVVEELVSLGFQGVVGADGYLANWNSLGRSGDAGGAFDDVSITQQTIGGGTIGFAGVSIGIPSLSIPLGVGIDVNIGNPNAPTSMIDAAVAVLSSYDDDDTIVLIGHSLGGNSVLEIARQVSVEIDVLALLDPVGYTPTAGAPIDFIPTPILGLNINFPNGFSNSEGDTPGFRSDIFGGGLDSVPSNVAYLYNRWQTNAPFPLDFLASGVLDLEPGFSGTNDQRTQNTRNSYGLGFDLSSGFAVVTGKVDLNPIAYDEVCIPFLGCAPNPFTVRLNSKFGTSNAQFHHDFPLNNTIQDELIAILRGTVPPIVADALEPNDTTGTATAIDSGAIPTSILATIHSPTDKDFFKVTIEDTGVLQVALNHISAQGDLDVRIRDINGNVIVTADSLNDVEALSIPVVRGDTYYVEIYGFNGATNEYRLTVVNPPVIPPSGIYLDPLSDTGSSNSDNVTTSTRPQLFIQSDVLELVDSNRNGIVDSDEAMVLTAVQAAAGNVPGVAIEVTLTNTTTGSVVRGFANPLSLTEPEVYSFTPNTSLGQGVHLVTARMVVFRDEARAGATALGQGRSTASPPLWMTILTDVPNDTASIDLTPSSDSGMFNNDMVTKVNSPAFFGLGEPNTKVRIFAESKLDGTVNLVGQGMVASDGTWEVTVEPLADGAYNFTADFEGASGVFSGRVGVSNSVFSASPGLVISDLTTINSNINLTGQGLDPVMDLAVTINIDHTFVGDLDIFLVGPDGTRVELTTDNGGSGQNFTNTTFDDVSLRSITTVTAAQKPYTARFRPEGSLSIFEGLDPNGIWTLEVTDDSNIDEGMLLDWSLNFITPKMVVIDTEAPNTPFLDLLTDSGRSNVDNITNDNTPVVTMTTTDPNIALAQLLFQDNLKFRLFDRFQGDAEFLLYDSVLDAAVDAASVVGDGFTSLTLILETLAAQFIALNPAGNAAVLAGGLLADGVHSLKLEVEDRAGNISHDFLFDLTIDTTPPPVSFGLPGGTDGLAQGSDSGVSGAQTTFLDRVTNNTSPRLWGLAEANSLVRVFVDVNLDGVIGPGDLLIGETVAVPYDGNHAFADGYWEITSVLNLNSTGFPLDGLRQLLVSAEDVAGNRNIPGDTLGDDDQVLDIFLDTQGPQITDVTIPDFPDFNLFAPKPSINGFTPLVNSLIINVRDLPNRLDQAGTDNDFLYEALIESIAENPGNYVLVGDHVGNIAIESIVWTPVAAANGQPATGTITLTFAAPLPDDRYTFRILDALVDPAGNKLDGETNAVQPSETITFPSGDGVPGGNFVARFTVDSRPEIGTYIPTTISIDINGNFVWDPASAQISNDFTNVDLTFNMQLEDPVTGSPVAGGYGVHDLVFAGKFFNPPPPGAAVVARPFDQLAVFGALSQNTYRWLIDTNSDGVVNPGDGDIFTLQPRFVNGFDTASAIPVAGDFDNDPTNGDEIGLYNAGRWALDTNRNFIIDAGDTFINSNLFGHPIVGDFNGDGLDDLAVHHAVDHQFRFDLDRNGTIDAVINWGFPGVLEIPVAADMNQDGIDDIGLWVPRNSTQTPRAEAEWFFLISDDSVPHGGFNVGNLDHAFKIVPFGTDITAHFGDEQARPIVGNFDPPVTAAGSQTPTPNVVIEVPGDFNRDGIVDMADRDLWKSQYGQTGSDLAADGNADGVVDTRDFLVWRNNLGKTTEDFAAAQVVSTPGDYNSDGIVDMADHDVWKSQFGMTGTLAADGNGDGKVDIRDFMVWRNNLSMASSEVSFGSGLVAAAEPTASPVAPLASDAAHESSDAAAMGTPVVGFRPMQRSGLTPLSAELPPAAVDALFAEDFDDLLLYGTQMLDEREQSDLGDLFDLFEEEDAVDEAELPVTL